MLTHTTSACGHALELDDARLTFAHRRRHARLDAGLTQKALGVAAGVAGLPLAPFHAEAEEMADAITALARLSAKERREVLIDLKARAEAS